MTEQFIKEQKQKLLEEEKRLEKELKSFAKPDSRIKENWKTKFPDFGIKTADLSEEEDQVEEYEATLPVEYALETRLKKIKDALERIKTETYGTCQKCKGEITTARLRANPEASFCIKCTEKEGGENK